MVLNGLIERKGSTKTSCTLLFPNSLWFTLSMLWMVWMREKEVQRRSALYLSLILYGSPYIKVWMVWIRIFSALYLRAHTCLEYAVGALHTCSDFKETVSREYRHLFDLVHDSSMPDSARKSFWNVFYCFSENAWQYYASQECTLNAKRYLCYLNPTNKN